MPEISWGRDDFSGVLSLYHVIHNVRIWYGGGEGRFCSHSLSLLAIKIHTGNYGWESCSLLFFEWNWGGYCSFFSLLTVRFLCLRLLFFLRWFPHSLCFLEERPNWVGVLQCLCKMSSFLCRIHWERAWNCRMWQSFAQNNDQTRGG